MNGLFQTTPVGIMLLSIACGEPNISKGESTSGTSSMDEGSEPPVHNGTDSGDIPPDADHPCAAGEAHMQLGTGEDEFMNISDGDEIEVIHGTQDGHHILGSLRTKNTSEIVAVRFQIIPTSDQVAVSDQTYRLLLLPDETGEPCSWTTTGMYAYLGRIDPGTAPFLDNPVLFQMDLVDDYGRELSQALEVIPYLTPVEHSAPPTAPTSK